MVTQRNKPSTPMFPRDTWYNASGTMYTKALFRETTDLNPKLAPFTLRAKNDGSWVSLKDLYIEFCVDDPSEATFAETVFGDVGIWLKLKEYKALQPFLKEWVEICEVKRKSKAFKTIVNNAKESFQAAKFLIEEPWKDKRVVTRKASKATTAKAALEHTEDLKRIQEYLQ